MNKPRKVLALAICLIFVLPLALAGCGGGGGGDDALVGIWTDEGGSMEFEFKSDGVLVFRFMGEEEQSTYSAKDGELSSPNPETGELSETVYRVDGDTLLMGVDGQEGTLVRKK